MEGLEETDLELGRQVAQHPEEAPVRGGRRGGGGVVGDGHRPAGGRYVLEPLDLAPEPVVVEEVDQRPVEESLHPLGSAPVVDLALGLDAWEVGTQVVVAARGKAGTSA